MLHKRLTGVSVRMQVEAVSHDTVRLSLTMPELGADGVYHLLGAEPVPAGSVLRSEGRCVERKLYWGPLQSTLHGDRILAARWRAAQ